MTSECWLVTVYLYSEVGCFIFPCLLVLWGTAVGCTSNRMLNIRVVTKFLAWFRITIRTIHWSEYESGAHAGLLTLTQHLLSLLRIFSMQRIMHYPWLLRVQPAKPSSTPVITYVTLLIYFRSSRTDHQRLPTQCSSWYVGCVHQSCGAGKTHGYTQPPLD